MAGNTNLDTRVPSRIASDTFEIFTVNDFPNEPVLKNISLNRGVYVISSDITIEESFTINPGAIVEFRGAGFGKVMTYTGDDPMFRSVNGLLLTMELLNIDLPEDDAVLFDLDGCNLTMVRQAIAWLGSGGSPGSVVGSAQIFSLQQAQLLGFDVGFTVDDVLNLRLEVATLVSDLSGTGACLSIGANTGVVSVDRSTFVAGASEQLFDFDSGYLGSANISRQINTLGATFFAPGGLDETAPNVVVTVSPPQKSSFNQAAVVVAGNTTAMVMGTENMWFDFDVDGSGVAGANMELWELVDASTLEIRYLGLSKFYGNWLASITFEPNSSKQFDLRIVKNGSPLSGMPSFGISGTHATVPMIVPLTAVELNDTFTPQIFQHDGTDSPTITDISIITIGGS